MNQALRSKLENDLDTVNWKDLKEHLLRGAIFRVAPELNIVDVAQKMAEDDVSQIQAWLKSKKVSPPSVQEVQRWEKSPEREFLILIVQPYVVIQDKAAVNN